MQRGLLSMLSPLAHMHARTHTRAHLCGKINYVTSGNLGFFMCKMGKTVIIESVQTFDPE